MDQTSSPPVKEEGTKMRTGEAAEAAAGLDTKKLKKNEGSSGDDQLVNDGSPGSNRSLTLGEGKKTVVDDEIQPLSGKPFFTIMISQSHLKPKYKMFMPAKLFGILPEKDIPAVLMCNGKEWEMLYIGNMKRNKRFSTQFKDFAVDNALKVDDACVFELMVCTESELRFRVQILRGDIPPEVQAIIDSKKRDQQPLVID